MQLIFILALATVVLTYLIYRRDREEFVGGDELFSRLKRDMVKLDPNLAKIEFYYSEDESYTEDKHRVYLCTHDTEGNLYDYNTLVYVCIHECAHALTEVVDPDHETDEFRDMFEHLLGKAERLGVYDRSLKMPDVYCGVDMRD